MFTELKNLDSIVKMVGDKMQERYPGCSSTITVLLWDDSDYLVSCKSMADDGITLRYYEYIKDELCYGEYPLRFKGPMLIDARGNEYYLRDEMKWEIEPIITNNL